MIILEKVLHEVLFPAIDFLYSDFSKRHGLDPTVALGDRRWRNAKCDVQSLWSHIFHGGGIFVTSDEDFHKPSKKEALIRMGAGDILSRDR